MSSKVYIKLRHVYTRAHSIYLYKHVVLVQSSTVGIYGTKSSSFHQDVLSLSVVVAVLHGCCNYYAGSTCTLISML